LCLRRARFLAGNAVNVIFRADGPTVQDHFLIRMLTYLDSVTRNFEIRIVCVVESGEHGAALSERCLSSRGCAPRGVTAPIAAALRPTQRLVPRGGLGPRGHGLRGRRTGRRFAGSQCPRPGVQAMESAPAQRNTGAAKIRGRCFGGAAIISFARPLRPSGVNTSWPRLVAGTYETSRSSSQIRRDFT